ncbi:uncharacterized protein LOC142597684 [Dermatophagoides farinae]|uniref:uncharacterized protein LOC142597684 n=1 Tax=Dermatophagoides farinae TaxID=6954 RepID=UPI003F5F8E7A
MDALESEANEVEGRLGRVVILASSFEGSARNMNEHYHDAMAIVAKYGFPELFITMTANTEWPEIIENLHQNQTAFERPDLIDRVFKKKLNHLMEIIYKKGYFGRCQAYVYTIEYQKRGLPHAHIIVWLIDGDKLDTPEKIDRYISAQIPPDNPDYEFVREIVLKHMVHTCMPNRCLNEDGECNDRAHVRVTTDGENEIVHDEVRNYIDSRYTAACEAIWRLLEFPMHDKSHAVYRLPVNLPQEQPVYFNEDDDAEQIRRLCERAARTDNMLTAFFKLNAQDSNANEFLYTELCEHYVWNKRSKKWEPRQRHVPIISRIYYVSARESDRFYLRLLLQNVKGPKSFEDLRTVNGQVCATFKEAAILRGLVANDSEWIECLTEASVYNLPKQMRQLYAQICIYNNPADPKDLFENFKEFMIGDFLYQDEDRNVTRAENLAKQHIYRLFAIQGYSADFLGPVSYGQNDQIDIEYETRYAEETIPLLNEKQREFFDEISGQLSNPRLHEKNSRFYFLDGPGGSGKTFTYLAIISYARSRGFSVAAFATTGIAADLLPGGRTVHSGFKIPIRLTSTDRSTMTANQYQARQVIIPADLLIIDEVSMMSIHVINIIDLLLKDLMQSQEVFGGKLIIFGGDFRQISPIVPRGICVSSADLSIKKSPLWIYAKRFSLSTNMRSANFAEYNEWLLKLGNGTLRAESSRITDPEYFPCSRSIFS